MCRWIKYYYLILQKEPWAGKKYLAVKNSQIAKAQPMSTDTLVEYDPILESSLMEKMYNLWYAAN